MAPIERPKGGCLELDNPGTTSILGTGVHLFAATDSRAGVAALGPFRRALILQTNTDSRAGVSEASSDEH